MYLAIIDTANFQFVAAGTDPAHAKRVLAAGWRKHKREEREAGAQLGGREYAGANISVDEILEDANVVEILAGDALRDGSPLVSLVR